MLFAIAVIVLLILDQALKYWVTLAIPLNEGVKGFIPGVLELRNIHNTGAAFSILSSASRWLFVVLAVAVTVVIIIAVRKQWVRGKFGRWMAILMLAGVLGNCLDRLLSGYVVDMFQFVFWPSFPVFNIADICLVVGAIGFCLHLFLYREPKEQEAAAPKPKKEKAAKPAAKPEPEIPPETVIAPEKDEAFAKALDEPAIDDLPTKKVDTKKIQKQPAKPAKPVKPVQEPKPVKESRPKQEKKPELAEDPFAAWNNALETLETQQQAQKAEAVEAQVDVPVKKPTPKPKPAVTEQPKKPAAPADDEFSFTLEDILKEYSGK